MNATPAVIAHRGASRAAPENTPAAFRLARELGAGWVELDVRRSSDDALVVRHDASFADGRRVVDVRAEDRPRGVPTLDEALDACAGMGVNVEIKNSSGEAGYDPQCRVSDLVVSVLQERDEMPILVSSFDVATLARVRALVPSIATALLTLVIDDPSAVIAAAVTAGHRALHPYDATVDRALVDAAHRAGLAVNVWTVDDATRIAQLASFGVDGICTNVPDVAVAVLRGLR